MFTVMPNSHVYKATTAHKMIYKSYLKKKTV